MSLLHTSLLSAFTTHVFTTCLYYTTLLHVFTACLYYMSLLLRKEDFGPQRHADEYGGVAKNQKK